jgi:hypothetical protein
MLSGKLYYNDKINIHTSSKRYGHPMILIYALRHNFNFQRHPLYIHADCLLPMFNFVIAVVVILRKY